MRALIVEDEAPIRGGMLRHVHWEELGIDEVRGVENAEAALSLGESYVPDIILSDIRMPGMDGMQLCALYRERFPDCQILFITGYSDTDYLKTAIELGVVAYLNKPVDRKELEAALTKAVQACERIRKNEEARKVMEVVEANPDVKAMVISRTESKKGGEERRLNYQMKEVIEYIEGHLSDPGLSLQILADHVGLTPTYLSNLFSRSMDMTFRQYVTEERIRKAKDLLKDPKLKQYEVAAAVGYEDPKYFARIFKDKVGMTPTEYRDSL